MSLFFQCTVANLPAVIQWMRVHVDGAAATTMHDAWATRLVTPPLPAEDDDYDVGTSARRRRQAATRRTTGKTRRRTAPAAVAARALPAAVTHSSGARYMRCSRRHAEIDLSLLGPEPLYVWHQCYLQCLDLARAASSALLLSTSTVAAASVDGPPPFALVLLNADCMPPALASVIHGYRTNVWHFPELPLQFVFVGRFLPCAALLPVRTIPSADFLPSSPLLVPAPLDPRRPMQSLTRVLAASTPGVGGATSETSSYPFYAVREELYRAQMFCMGLPEIVEDDAGAIGDAFLRSAQCRADLGDWAARNRSVFHAEKLVHAFQQQQQQQQQNDVV